MLTIFLLLSSFMFLISNHPLSMILIIISITTFLSFHITTTLSFPWFSYILILILLGAMLIIFLYMTSLAPNEILSWKKNKKILPLIFISPLLLMFPQMTKSSYFFSNFLFSQLPSFLTLLTASYLLITMISIVKISSISSGPMKSN